MSMRDQLLKRKKRQNQTLKKRDHQRQVIEDNYAVNGVKDMFDLSTYDECFIVGGGPSLKTFDWSLLDNKFVIAVNRAYEVLPNAQIMYFTDKDFWDRHKESMLAHTGKIFRGTLTLGNIKHPRVTEWILSGENGFDWKSGKLKHGRNSSYAALNLAVAHLGFKKIRLLGMDMKWGRKGDRKTSHFHDGHKRIDSERIYTLMASNFKKIAPMLQQKNIEVLNVNNDTNLKAFPIVSTGEFFNKYQKPGDIL